MKKLIFSSLVVLGLGLTSCNSERKDDGSADTLGDTSMNASPGLDTSGVGTDTSMMDTTNMDTTSNRPNQ